jgi:hypothetical protein
MAAPLGPNFPWVEDDVLGEFANVVLQTAKWTLQDKQRLSSILRLHSVVIIQLETVGFNSTNAS